MSQSVTTASREPVSDWPITTTREFLAFKLGKEEHGIGILRVQSIRSYEQPTRMGNAPGARFLLSRQQ